MPVSTSLPISLASGPVLVTQGFGGGSHKNGTVFYHALDIAVPKGTPILAEARGKIVALRETVPDGASASGSANDPSIGSGGVGNYVTVLYDNGVYASYLHLQHNGVVPQLGATVAAGTILGFVGNTGQRTGTHLHVQYGTKLTSVQGNTIADGSNANTAPVVFNTATGIVQPGIVSDKTCDLHLNKTLSADQHNLTLVGTASINGYGDGFGNIISGNAGNNIIDGRGGADTMAGGRGNDTYHVDHAGDVVRELASEGTDTVVSSINYTLGSNLENLNLVGAATKGTGNALNNEIVGDNFHGVALYGLGGNDALRGGRGDDVLDGGTGADAM